MKLSISSEALSMLLISLSPFQPSMWTARDDVDVPAALVVAVLPHADEAGPGDARLTSRR